MVYLVVLLSMITMGLIIYIFMINRQLDRVTNILKKRLQEQSSQIVSVDLINRHINQLAECINECLKAEESLRLRLVKEEKKFKELMANISHDLRTPLTAIKGYQQMLEKEEMTKGQKEKLTIAIKNTKTLERLIEHFFEYTYMVNYTPKCSLERINITNLISECLVSAVTMFEESQIEVDYDDSILAYIMADKELINRVIQNLIRNCLQHAKGKIKVCIVEQKEGESLMAGFSFSNQLLEHDHIDSAKIFERFYTSDAARSSSTGLGLAIVKLLTKQMSGVVSANNNNGMLEICVLLPKA